MSVSEKLKKAVSEKDFVAIRDSLWSRIALDPNFTKGFPVSWEYCLNNGISERKFLCSVWRIKYKFLKTTA